MTIEQMLNGLHAMAPQNHAAQVITTGEDAKLIIKVRKRSHNK